jgi:hypothetical protein
MNQSEIESSVDEIQQWVKRVRRGLITEREHQGADPRILDMLIESLEAEVRRLAVLINEQ